MIRFSYHPSPNPAKVAQFVEANGLPRGLVPMDTRKGGRFDRGLLAGDGPDAGGSAPAVLACVAAAEKAR